MGISGGGEDEYVGERGSTHKHAPRGHRMVNISQLGRSLLITLLLIGSPRAFILGPPNLPFSAKAFALFLVDTYSLLPTVAGSSSNVPYIYVSSFLGLR